jgi:catechol 2,3-dioxygenase-like lactoylglutathione lyase family enzyme
MVRTHGLTHLNLAMRDLERALRFYHDVFGVNEYFRDEDSIQVLGPGPHDVIAFERSPQTAGRSGGISPGMPFAYVADPDGYEIEIWYECPPNLQEVGTFLQLANLKERPRLAGFRAPRRSSP